ncbi:hypothetical protein ACJX0J_027687, partial [Zea mays]
EKCENLSKELNICNDSISCLRTENGSYTLYPENYPKHKIRRLHARKSHSVSHHAFICQIYKICSTCQAGKQQFHFDDCGICRVGGKENFFHCQTCGSCYSTTLRDRHCCIENSMKNNCPICYEYLFDSLRETSVLHCGHTMHLLCFHEMLKHD